MSGFSLVVFVYSILDIFRKASVKLVWFRDAFDYINVKHASFALLRSSVI